MSDNIVWQQMKVSREDRERLLGQRGLVVWFTGLSGSGKSTIAVEVESILASQGHKSYVLDGDNIRHGINADLGFTDEDRNENIRRITEISSLFADAGIITLVSFISPFREMREQAKKRIGEKHFLEVYVKADLETCRERDPKGLYQKKIAHFTGVSSGYEEPEQPDIILDTETCSIAQCAELVIKEITRRNPSWTI